MALDILTGSGPLRAVKVLSNGKRRFDPIEKDRLTDAMVDLLIETVHKIGTRSKRKVVSDIAKDIERVYGKERLLVEIASASIEEPSGRVCDVIFPIVGKDKLAAIVKESQAKGALDRRIYKVMRSSWANHYRRMLPSLLSVLEFRSNNTMWRPVLAALDWIRSKMGAEQGLFKILR